MDKEAYGKAWGIIATAICQIYGKNASMLSFEELYRLVLFGRSCCCLSARCVIGCSAGFCWSEGGGMTDDSHLIL